MKKLLASLVAVVMLFGTVGLASAVTDLIGDKDGFGIGVPAGAVFDHSAVGSTPDPDGLTDAWVHGTQSWTHTYSLPDSIVSAAIDVFHGGDGWDGASSLFLGSTFIGYLTDSDDVGGSSYSYAVLDTFDLTPFIGLLTGSDTFTLQTIQSGDGWVLDYSELTVTPVPEPASLLLLGSGLLGLVGFGRKKKEEEV